MVPQHWKLNRGEGSSWYAMEMEWAQALDREDKVEVNMELTYPSGSQRPNRFEVTWKVNGKSQTREFENKAGG